MIIGKISTTGDGHSSYSKKSKQSIFSHIDNSFGGAFIYVGEKHIQVIVTINGKEVYRNFWEKQ